VIHSEPIWIVSRVPVIRARPARVEVTGQRGRRYQKLQLDSRSVIA
jgi:hypothetical protein